MQKQYNKWSHHDLDLTEKVRLCADEEGRSCAQVEKPGVVDKKVRLCAAWRLRMLRLLRTTGEIWPGNQNSSVVCKLSESILRTSGEICPGSQNCSVVRRLEPQDA